MHLTRQFTAEAKKRSRAMRSAVVALLTIEAFLGGCSSSADRATAEPTVPTPSSKQAVTSSLTHQVRAAGADASCVPTTAPPEGCGRFSLAATAFANGKVTGEWLSIKSNGQVGAYVAIDCLRVEATTVGNAAVVSGVVTRGQWSGTDVAGQRVVAAVLESAAAQDPRDLASGLLPAGDATCDRVTLRRFDLRHMQSGQVVIQ